MRPRLPNALPVGWFDISPPVSAQTAVFPGDTHFCRHEFMGFGQGDHLALSRVESTLHIGAHADAPSHYAAGGEGIDTRPLNRYIGDAQVVTVTTTIGGSVAPADVRQPITAARVLFKTHSHPDPQVWTDDFTSLSPELVAHLAGLGVALIGIDTPSIDPAPAKVLHAHHAVFAHDLAVLEGLVLRDVPDGLYTLLAQPLRLVGGDAAPVRAVLVPHVPALETLPRVAPSEKRWAVP